MQFIKALFSLIKNFAFQTFYSKGNISSMRVGLIAIIIMAGYLVLCIGIHILKKTWELNGIIDWLGVSAFLGAIGLFITPVIMGKNAQKKVEIEAEKNQINNEILS